METEGRNLDPLGTGLSSLRSRLRAIAASGGGGGRRVLAVAGVGAAAFAVTLWLTAMHRVPEGTVGMRRSDGVLLQPGERYFALRDSAVAIYPARVELRGLTVQTAAAGGERLRGRLDLTGTLAVEAIRRIAAETADAPDPRGPEERIRKAVLEAAARALSLREARELVLSSPFALRVPWLPAAGVERGLEVESSQVDLISVESLRSVAAGLYAAGGRTAVEGFLDRAGAARPGDAAPVCVRADLARMEGDASRAELLYLEALELDPVLPAPMEALVVHSQLSGANLDRTERLLQRALAARPESIPHLNWLSLVLARKGDLRGAEAALVRALSFAPEDAATSINLASLMDRQERRLEAIEQLQRVLEKHPEHPLALYNLGSALAEDGKLDEAIATLERAASSSLPSVRLYARLAAAYEKRGDAARAAEYRRKAESLELERRGKSER